VFKYSILVVIVFLAQVDLHAAEHRYSNYVSGNSYQKNSPQFLSLIDEKFFSYEGNEKKLDVSKLRNMRTELTAKHKQLLDSFQQSIKVEFINRHQLSDKKSDKRAARRTGKEARVNLPFIVLDERLEYLIQNHRKLSPDQIEAEISTMMIYYQAVESAGGANLYQVALESVKSLLPPWYDIPKQNSPEMEALNLLENDQFLSTEQLVEKHKHKVDFSLLNPPSSAFWQDN